MANLLPTPREEIARVATNIADTLEWLLECPLPKADAVFETTNTILMDFQDYVRIQARQLGDEAILESVNGAIDECEYPDDDEILFWRTLAQMAKGE